MNRFLIGPVRPVGRNRLVVSNTKTGFESVTMQFSCRFRREFILLIAVPIVKTTEETFKTCPEDLVDE